MIHITVLALKNASISLLIPIVWNNKLKKKTALILFSFSTKNNGIVLLSIWERNLFSARFTQMYFMYFMKLIINVVRWKKTKPTSHSLMQWNGISWNKKVYSLEMGIISMESKLLGVVHALTWKKTTQGSVHVCLFDCSVFPRRWVIWLIPELFPGTAFVAHTSSYSIQAPGGPGCPWGSSPPTGQSHTLGTAPLRTSPNNASPTPSHNQDLLFKSQTFITHILSRMLASLELGPLHFLFLELWPIRLPILLLAYQGFGNLFSALAGYIDHDGVDLHWSLQASGCNTLVLYSQWPHPLVTHCLCCFGQPWGSNIFSCHRIIWTAPKEKGSFQRLSPLPSSPR